MTSQHTPTPYQDHDHHPGLGADLARLLAQPATRRQSLRWLCAGAGTALLPLAGCGGDTVANDYGISSSTTSSGAGSTAGTGGGAACSLIPEETAGPYPGDGSNRNANGVANALVLSGIVRGDIRASVAGASGVAQGVPLTIRLKIENVARGCAAAAGAAIYRWHCTREGGYSMYSNGIVGENYLRGVQEADADGWVTFTTIFPGCYDGRMPHVHFEVYPTLAASTSAANRVRTSQFGFPLATLAEAYASSGYASSVGNLARVSYATDNVFSDGTALQMASVTGNASQGYSATLTVGVSF